MWWMLFYLTNRWHFSVRVYCNRSLMTPQRVKNKKYDTRRSRVTWLLFFTRCDVFCDLLQYTCTGKCHVFVLYNKISNGVFNNLGGLKEEKQVRWRDMARIRRHLCVCPFIDHGQQPMKMLTEVTLLYKVT